MNVSQWNISKGTLFVSLLLAAFGMLLLPQRWTEPLNTAFRGVFNRVLSFGRQVESSRVTMPVSSDEYVRRSEYNRLYASYKNTHAQLLAMQEQYSRLARIRSGLPKLGSALVLAQVTNVFLSPEEQELIISPSTATEGLAAGQYVIADDTVVGEISAVSRTTARVRLLTDPKQVMPVLIWREGADAYIRAQMQGKGNGLARIGMLSRSEHKIFKGDTVYADARAGVLETPTLIGQVVDCRADPAHPLLWDITVLPVCEAAKLREVAVICMEAAEKPAGR